MVEVESGMMKFSTPFAAVILNRCGAADAGPEAYGTNELERIRSRFALCSGS